ncbi:MAG: hypothetical protein II920_04105 [Clostridia bacterium]|nr:hypothetical protein [Clostridia bacterium]
MKKLLALCLILALCPFAMSETAGLANPVKEYATLEEINDIVGGRLCHPAVMGVTDERFSVINAEVPIAQYQYSLNGLEYCFRCAATADFDISGVWIDGKEAFGEYGGEIDYAWGEGMKLARWFEISGQYVLMLEDAENVMSEETFIAISEEMRSLTSDAMSESEKAAFYAELEGEYQDNYSLRASASVSANGSEGALMEIWWGNSAFETCCWTMTLRLGEDGLLYYDDCICSVVAVEEGAEEGTVTVLYENGAGYFSFLDGILYWTGAEDEYHSQCEFQKI